MICELYDAASRACTPAKARGAGTRRTSESGHEQPHVITRNALMCGSAGTLIQMDGMSADFACIEGASEQAIQRAERELETQLPADYLNQMRSHNGGERWVGGGAYLRLWPIDDLLDRHRTLEAELLVPGFALIGTDGVTTCTPSNCDRIICSLPGDRSGFVAAN